MKKFFYSIAIISISIFLLQCTAKKAAVSKPMSPDVLTFAKKRWPDITQQDLDSGRRIYTTRCTKCHGMKKIAKRSEKAWIKILRVMTRLAKLTPGEKITLAHYILAAREAGVKKD